MGLFTILYRKELMVAISTFLESRCSSYRFEDNTQIGSNQRRSVYAEIAKLWDNVQVERRGATTRCGKTW